MYLFFSPSSEPVDSILGLLDLRLFLATWSTGSLLHFYWNMFGLLYAAYQTEVNMHIVWLGQLKIGIANSKGKTRHKSKDPCLILDNWKCHRVKYGGLCKQGNKLLKVKIFVKIMNGIQKNLRLDQYT